MCVQCCLCQHWTQRLTVACLQIAKIVKYMWKTDNHNLMFITISLSLSLSLMHTCVYISHIYIYIHVSLCIFLYVFVSLILYICIMRKSCMLSISVTWHFLYVFFFSPSLSLQNSGFGPTEAPDDKSLVGFAQLTINDLAGNSSL